MGEAIQAKEAVVSIDCEKFEPGLEEKQKEIRGKITVDNKDRSSSNVPVGIPT